VNAPPSIALALMAWALAKWRHYGVRGIAFPFEDRPMPRVFCFPTRRGAYSDYYRILDRISAGKKP